MSEPVATSVAATSPPPGRGRLVSGYVLLALITAVTVGAVFANIGEAPASTGQSSGAATELSPEKLFGRLMLAIAAVLVVARTLGALARRIGQPQVMGEVVGGILLGASLLGWIAPEVQAVLFPPQVVPLLGGAADIGLAFYMFLVGLELDLSILRGRLSQAVFLSNASVIAPMAIGMSLAFLLFPTYGQGGFLAFALFMGVAMSVTAFPVLARILLERRMLRRPVGAISIASAAVDDATAWSLLAFAAAVATTASGIDAVVVLALGGVLTVVILLPGRRLLARVGTAYDEAGHIPSGWMSIIFISILMGAFAAAQIGIAATFGAFMVGLAMPRRSDLGKALTERVEPLVVAVLLPLFFVVTGLKTNLGLISGDIALITLLLLGAAVLGKFGGGMAAARFVGFGLRESAAIGALLNTRGLTELIVLNVGRDLGVLSDELFTALIVVALATTLMTGPALRVIDPRRELSEEPDARLEPAQPGRPRRVLVAVEDLKNLQPLIDVAVPLAQGFGSELIVVHTLVPSRVSAGITRDDEALQRAQARLEEVRDALAGQGISARVTAFPTAAPGADVVALAERQDAALIILDGQRRLFGAGITGRAVNDVLARANADVGVLVQSGGTRAIGKEHPAAVPFGGSEHDWAAVEVGAAISAAAGALLRLVGIAGDPAEGRAGSERLVAEAAFLAQRLAGARTESRVVPPEPGALIAATADAGLLVIGLSERWRREGLGSARAGLVRQTSAPILFVRSGAKSRHDAGTVVPWSQVIGGEARPTSPSGQRSDDLEAPQDPV